MENLEKKLKKLKNYSLPDGYDDRFFEKLSIKEDQIKETEKRFNLFIFFMESNFRIIYILILSFSLMFISKLIIIKPDLLRINPDQLKTSISLAFIVLVVSVIFIIKIPKNISRGGY